MRYLCADSTPLQDGLTIPEEIKRREDRVAKLGEAKRVMEERAKERLLEEKAQYEEKLAARQAREDATGRKARGKAPEPPKEGPRDKDQYNFTDPESRIMKAGSGFEQCYNAQAAVEVTTMLIVGEQVTDQANDKQQLVPTLAVVSPVINQVAAVLVDSGYFSENAVQTVESAERPPIVYAAMNRQSHGRSVAQLEARDDPPPPPPGASVAERMAQRLDTAQGKEIYGRTIFGGGERHAHCHPRRPACASSARTSPALTAARDRPHGNLDFSKYRLTRSRCGVGSAQQTRQASVRKETLNTGGFFVPARERRAP